MIYHDMYLKWQEKKITDFSSENINSLYNEGFLFTRIGKGVMQQTRSVRVELSEFELSSENRRILRKTEDTRLRIEKVPLAQYSWEIGKMGKDFYETKFGEHTFSANKIKELLTDETKSNFNTIFTYTIGEENVGYCVAFETDEIIHYCYPFYNLSPLTYSLSPNTGLGMMLRAILWAKEHGKKYVYLGSAQRPTDTYKFQFTGTEWFDGKEWNQDAEELKKVL